MGLTGTLSAFGAAAFSVVVSYANPSSAPGNIPGASLAFRVAHVVFPEIIDGAFHSGVEDSVFSPQGEFATDFTFRAYSHLGAAQSKWLTQKNNQTYLEVSIGIAFKASDRGRLAQRRKGRQGK